MKTNEGSTIYILHFTTHHLFCPLSFLVKNSIDGSRGAWGLFCVYRLVGAFFVFVSVRLLPSGTGEKRIVDTDQRKRTRDS